MLLREPRIVIRNTFGAPGRHRRAATPSLLMIVGMVATTPRLFSQNETNASRPPKRLWIRRPCRRTAPPRSAGQVENVARFTWILPPASKSAQAVAHLQRFPLSARHHENRHLFDRLGEPIEQHRTTRIVA